LDLDQRQSLFRVINKRGDRKPHQKGVTIRLLNSFGTFLLIGICLSGSLSAQDHPGPPEKPRVPNLIFNTIDTKQWSLDKNRGNIVILNFWATWCGPCRTEIPYLVKIADEYKKRGVNVVGVSLDEPGSEIVKKFAAEHKINYPILFPDPDSPFWKIENLPMTLLIDREGRLAAKYTGAVPENILRADIAKLLGD
jgi:cytochrome c biogenesis protein CcmG/thiol:disulfide interchange protein DsbE